MMRNFIGKMLFFSLCPFPAIADCTNPAANEGTKEYFTSIHRYKFCDGTSWQEFSPCQTLTACSDEGVWDYDSGQGAFKYCDGTDWKIVNSSTALTACITAGSIEYDISQHYYKYCDGINWYPMLPLPVTSNLVAHWKFNETTGTTAVDSLGSHNATLVNGPVWQPTGGIIDGALNFDGSNDEVNIPHSASFNFGTGDFSISGWVKGNYTLSSGEYPRMYEKFKTSGTEQGISVYTSGSTNRDFPECEVIINGSYYNAAATGVSVRDGNWHQITCIRNGNVLKIYVNGLQRGSVSGLSGSIDTTVNPSIGYSRGWGSDYYEGTIDDVRIYNRALTDDEVTDLYNGGVGCQ